MTDELERQLVGVEYVLAHVLVDEHLDQVILVGIVVLKMKTIN